VIFEGLVESLHFSAGGGVVGGGVDLGDVQVAQFGFVLVAAAFAAGESGGSEHAVVGAGGCRNAMCAICITEFSEDDGAGDAVVGGD
jgi:hypothetical protein